MRLLFVPLLLLCISWGSPKPKIPEVVELPTVVVDSSNIKPYLTVKKCTNCTVDEWKFIKQGVVKTNETVESTCFESFMLERKLIQSLDRTNLQVYRSLAGAGIEIDVEMYYTIKRVLGYTLADQKVGQYKEWLNRRYMVQWNHCDLASTFGHETAHKVGYSHDFRYSKSRDFSVPYSVGFAFDKCCVR